MSKRQEMREKRAKQQQMQRMAFGGIIIIGAILVALLLIWPNLRPVGEIAQPEQKVDHPQALENSMGDPNAPIKIVEYSNYLCVHCQRFAVSTEYELISAFIATGKVHFTKRSWVGTTQTNDEGFAAAQAAYCAADQGKYWEYHDLLFANWTGAPGDYTPRRLSAYAENIGLNTSDFNSCLNGNKHTNRVRQDYSDGVAAGVTGTPSFILKYTVNGEEKTEMLQGAQPFAAFEQSINTALQEMGLQP